MLNDNLFRGLWGASAPGTLNQLSRTAGDLVFPVEGRPKPKDLFVSTSLFSPKIQGGGYAWRKKESRQERLRISYP